MLSSATESAEGAKSDSATDMSMGNKGVVIVVPNKNIENK